MAADQVLLLVAEQPRDAVVDEGEFAVEIEDVDQVGRVVDHVAVQALGMFQPVLDSRLLLLDAHLVERVVNRVLELVEVERLAEDVVGAEPHRLGDLVDRGLAADDDHRRRDPGGANEREDLVARFLRHVQIENDQAEAALADQPDCLLAVLGLDDVGPFVLEQLDQALAGSGFVVDDEECLWCVESVLLFFGVDQLFNHNDVSSG